MADWPALTRLPATIDFLAILPALEARTSVYDRFRRACSTWALAWAILAWAEEACDCFSCDPIRRCLGLGELWPGLADLGLGRLGLCVLLVELLLRDLVSGVQRAIALGVGLGALGFGLG